MMRNRPNIKVQDADQVRDLSQLAVAVAPTLETRRVAKYKDKTTERVTIVGTSADYMETSNVEPEIGRFLSALRCQSGGPR